MPSKSKSQQRLFGMVHSYNKGEFHGSKKLRKYIESIANNISDEDARHFAETAHRGLPEKKAYAVIAIEKLAQTTTPYTIAKGDTLSSLGLKHGVTADAIATANGIKDKNRISIGQKINIPSANSPIPYTIAKGDTLSSIGLKHGVTANAIAAANGIKDINKIRLGQKINIPSAAKATQTTPAAPKVPISTTIQSVGINPVASELHNAFENSNLEAGILANIDRETGGTFNYQQWQGNKKQTFDPKIKQTGGYGLFQLTGNNLTGYKNYLLSNNLKDSATNQIGFVKNVYGPSRSGWKKNVDTNSGITSEQAADWWHKKVETPAHVIKSNPNYSVQKTQQATDRHNEFMKNKIRLVDGVWQSQ